MRRVAIGPIVAVLLTALTSTIAASGTDGSYTCSSSSACFSASQSAPPNSSGAGFHGTAVNGPGVRGNATNSVGLLGQSASGTMLEPGVEGESTATSGNDVAGGFGLSALAGGHTPQYAVYGVGVTDGVFGEDSSASSSKSSAGVVGMDTTGLGTGVLGESNFKQTGFPSGVAGIIEPFGINARGMAVYGLGAGAPQEQDGSGAYGGYFVANTSTGDGNGNFYGIGAESSGIAGDFFNNTSQSELRVEEAVRMLYGVDGDSTFSIDNSANFTTSGSISATGTVTGSNIKTSGDATYSQNGASGSTLTAYGMRTASPELEDVGDAQLVNGRAIVHIDAKLADVMDRRSAYHVFLTPDGDSKGLYVAQKTPTSFVVAEQQGGRSTMEFDYRIVATPYGHARERLALAPPSQRPEMPHLTQRSATAMRMPTFVQPPDRALRASLGPQRYAKLIAAKHRELSRP